MTAPKTSTVEVLGISAAGGTAGELVRWLFHCWAAHAVIVPDEPVAALLGAMLVPIIYAIANRLVRDIDPNASIPEGPTS